jgi:hypothetical protein
MIRRRLLICGTLAGFILLGIGLWLFAPRTAITRENAARIEQGMTLAEVEAILGGPSRNDATGPVVADEDEEPMRLECHQYITAMQRIAGDRGPVHWQSNRVIVSVSFGDDGRVRACSCILTRPADEGPLDMLRRWLGL